MDELNLNQWRGRRVLITGGTGFVGRHVVGRGQRAGVELHVVARTPVRDAPWHQHQIDLRDRRRVSELVASIKPEAIIHLAAAGVIADGTHLSHLIEVNAGGLASLLSAAADAALTPQVVVAGSGFEYAEQDRPVTEDDPVAPASAYGVSKACAALVAAHFADRLAITLLRLFSVYGEGEREPRLIPSIISSARRDASVNLTGCEQIRDFTSVGDVAEGFWRVLASAHAPGELRVLNIGTGRPMPLRALVEALAFLLRERGLSPRPVFGAIPYRPGEPMTYVASVERLEATLNWRPTTAVETGLRRAVEAAL